MFIVAKPFNTVNRRFRAGAEVAESDDLAPHDFADLHARGFIAAAGEHGDKPGLDKAALGASHLAGD